ncbi:SusD/RagB family nutrient-binding outer membrane lipoprotein [Pedobacter sp. SYP-B3415]|uniref:SusD/RagB family nutrient-binding outer membrane lipoprotein n=1 Tax=Pedobacter sp. SYP-B3415 TaxID=2496641 RepID=UPI00101C22E5|nr:SusD/RagB family nutrient-binding outer membrane lipoprotein [Pedobacter sp. SYP-B3415]
MKKIKYTALGSMIVVSALLGSCDKNFTEINKDPINIVETTPEKLLAPALVNVMNANMLRNRNFNNELMQVTVTISDGDATVFRYEFRNTFSDNLWNSWYPQLTNLKDVYALASAGKAANKSYQGISLVAQSWVSSMLTDTYGDVPYSEANKGKEGLLEPVFDKQKDIYLDMFKKLEEANTLLAAGTAIKATSDPVFKGDIGKWRRFCNSLYLRLLLRVSGKSEVSAQCIAKIKEIVETNAANYPVMGSNSDVAIIRWNGGTNTTDPFTSPFVNGVRAQDFRAPSMASFFIDRLRDWGDPRIDNSAKWGNSGVNRLGISQGPNGYSGVPSGYAVGSGFLRQAYFISSDDATNGTRSLQVNPLTGILMTYAELQFILAEASVKGWITGSAEQYYYRGMAAAINYWVPNFPANPADAAFVEYVDAADLTWDPAGSLDNKMEQIHIQKYYSLFCTDLQQWFEYRRTGHPVLPKGPGLRNGGVMPARMVYPVYVQSANPTNYRNAVAGQGADLISTNVWWQKAN